MKRCTVEQLTFTR